jgi:hypothetical protein
MKVFVRRKYAHTWDEIPELAEVSISLENGGQIDFVQKDAITLRACLTNRLNLHIEKVPV